MSFQLETSKYSSFELPSGECLKIFPPTIVEDAQPQLEAKLPLVRLAGSPEEIGAKQGSKLRERIGKCRE